MIKEIEIWQPRYKDNVCLIAKHKVGEYNIITFTKAKHLAGREYKLKGETIRKYPLDSNGKIPCYAVDMDEMEAMREQLIKEKE